MVSEIEYLNFDLLIEQYEGKYRARVISSPSGEATYTFENPFSELELEVFYLRVGRPRQGVRRIDSPEMETARTYGQRIFQNVFGGEVFTCYVTSLAEARHRNKGLRLRLRLAAPELGDIPWEYLYDPQSDRFLTLSTETPVVRYTDLSKPVKAQAVTLPLNVLVMISSPADYAPLDVEQEWKKLSLAVESLESRGLIKLVRLEAATLDALQRALRRGEYHIFHFIGHGSFDERAQDGLLLFEDQHGRGRLLNGRYLGTLLHDHRSLRLAVLNACEGARSSRTDPFAGVAQSLVQQGIPAVIAMQFEITDDAAITFTHELYAALVDGYPLDAALGEARKSIFAKGNDIEWGTPVYFTRTPDGRLFDIVHIDIPAEVPPDTPPGEPAHDPGRLRTTASRLETQEQAFTEGTTQAAPPDIQTVRLQDEPQQTGAFQAELLSPIPETVQTPAEAAVSSPPASQAQPISGRLKPVWIGLLAVLGLVAGIFILSSILNPPETPEMSVVFVPTHTEQVAVLVDRQTASPTAGTTQTPTRTATATQTTAPTSTTTPTRKPTSTFTPYPQTIIDRRGIEMQFIPAGSFTMGTDPDQALIECRLFRDDCTRGFYEDEEPLHKVTLDAYYIDVYEVTNEAYARCVAAGACEAPQDAASDTRSRYYDNPQYDGYPVIYVNWFDAQAFCEWRGARLPTEAEWEKAGRGEDNLIYPWGNTFDGLKTNFCDKNCTKSSRTTSFDDGYIETAPVGAVSGDISQYGVHDMAGNVWEWVADWYSDSYYSDQPVSNPQGPSQGEMRSIRGGTWNAYGNSTRMANRNKVDPKQGYDTGGFRCALTP